jgi:hypothetical protein
MQIWRRNTLVVTSLISALVMLGCAYGPMQVPTSAGMVVYTKGARQHTATVQLAVPAAEVYAAMLRITAQRPNLKILNKEDKRYLLELTDGERSVAAQATELDANSSLLFIWSDAGESGQTGQSISLKAMRDICAELKVHCEMQDL